MIVEALPGRPTRAVRDALLSHGWEGESSLIAAASLEPWGYHLTALAPGVTEALLPVAARFSLDLHTGPDWAILSGSRSRLSAMARAWNLPPALAEVAVQIGQGLPADAPSFWRIGSGSIGLDDGPVVLDGDGYASVTTGEATPDRLAGLVADGVGVLLEAEDPSRALAQLAAALDRANLAGLDPEQIAVDPRWTPGARLPDLALCRALGRPIVATTEDPVTAALAWLRGARLFRTGHPGDIRRAIACAAEVDG